MSEHHLQLLRGQALGKIKIAAEEGRLIDSPRLLMYLYRWRDWGDIDEARTWVSEQTNSDVGMLEFLIKTKSKITTVGGNHVGSRVRYEVDIAQIEPFADVPVFALRAVNILGTQVDLSDEHQRTLAELIKTVEMRKTSAGH